MSQIGEIQVGDFIVLKSSSENFAYGNEVHRVESVEQRTGDGSKAVYFVEGDPGEHHFNSVMLATDYLEILSVSKLNMAAHLAIIDAQIKELTDKKEITQKKLNSVAEYSSVLKSSIIKEANKIIDRLNKEWNIK